MLDCRIGLHFHFVFSQKRARTPRRLHCRSEQDPTYRTIAISRCDGHVSRENCKVRYRHTCARMVKLAQRREVSEVERSAGIQARIGMLTYTCTLVGKDDSRNSAN